ncbi:MAG: alpha-2-macroglobulin family protein, partial [Planctomycetota bacterium]
CATAGMLVALRAKRIQARSLYGLDLLGNLRGYLRVDRIEEAAGVLAAIEHGGAESDCLDQARYEVARAYVEAGQGELAIALLDKISLHNRSFDFQRAVLREKIRGLYSFFFDPSGDLRTPAQLKDYVYHSQLNPDEKLRPRNPVGFEDPNKLIDYFEKVASQLEDVLEIQGLPRSEEPALADGYDAIQILLYGRGEITLEQLEKNLATSPTSGSARTTYLLGSQHFAEADYPRALQVWGRLLGEHPDSDEARRAFEKAYELFEGRRVLAPAFAFWPIDRPAWIDEAAARPELAEAAAAVRKRIEGHIDVARYQERVVIHTAIANMKRDIFKSTAEIVHEKSIESPVVIHEEPDDPELILDRDHSLGWRLQTEFREFNIRRVDPGVLAPGSRKTLELRTSYYGEVRFRALKFPDGAAYQKFKSMPAAEAVAFAAALPEVKSWRLDLGSMARNGDNSSRDVDVSLKESGFYLITARARYAPVVAVTQMAIVAHKVLTWSSPNGVTYRVVDRETGAPVPGARVHGKIEPAYDPAKIAPELHDGSRSREFVDGFKQGFLSGKRDELMTDNDDFLAGFAAGLKLRAKYPFDPQAFEVRTDTNGVARAAVPEKWRGHACRVHAELGELGQVCPIESLCSVPDGRKSWRALFYAERPIFSPGEKARIKGLLRHLNHAGLSLPDREEMEFMLWKGRRLVSVMRAAPNEIGTVSLEARLPATAPLGAYSVTIGHSGRRYPVFKVDRFEMPLLDVRVEMDAEAVYAGSSARGRVTVHHAGLVPASGLPVEVSVYSAPSPDAPKPYDPREDFFEDVKLVDYPETPSQEAFRARVRSLKRVWGARGLTAADGSFTFAFDSERGSAMRYVVIARVKALSNRWESARAEVLTSRLPVFLTVRPERRHYYPGETLKARITTRGLDGKPLSAQLRLFVTRHTSEGRRRESTENVRTDAAGSASIAVALGKRAPDIEIGIRSGGNWIRRRVNYTLRQIGAKVGSGHLTVKVDRRAYYPGEKAKVRLEVSRPGADVFVTVSREKILRSLRAEVAGSSGEFQIPITESDAPNVYLQAESVWNDEVHKAVVEIPVVPAYKFLKVAVITDREEYTGGQPVSATIQVTDSRGAPARNVEVSLAAVRSSAFAIQEDLTPDLARYFLNYRRPLLVNLGAGAMHADDPVSGCYWLRTVFAWGVYRDLVSDIPLGGGGMAGCFGYLSGGGRRRAVSRFGGSAATERADRELYGEFLKQHGLTLFWESRLTTDEKGRAKVEFLLPPNGGEFRFTARAINAETFVGEIRKTVRYRRELIVQAPWPTSVREGERFVMPVFVVNGSPRTRSGMLTIECDLPARLVSGGAEVQVPPGGVVRRDVEVDARSLPPDLSKGPGGWQAPLALARFTARCEAKGGLRAETRAVVRVRRSGIPVERFLVAVARRGEGERTVRIDLTRAIPGSARLEVIPLAGPDEWIEWLRGRIEAGSRAHGLTSAWAAEAGAQRLAHADIAAGKTLPIGRDLLRAFAESVSYVREDEAAPYFLSCTSARARGVALPPYWA